MLPPASPGDDNFAFAAVLQNTFNILFLLIILILA